MKSILGNLAEGKIGVDIWTKGLSDWLHKYFPKAEFVDGKRVLSQAKMIKTKDEIECQKIANMITEAGFQALLENLKPGAKECELLAIAWKKFTELGSEWSQCANIVCSGPYTAPYRRFTSAARAGGFAGGNFPGACPLLYVCDAPGMCWSFHAFVVGCHWW